jgi:hypothetical protein
MFGSEGAPGVVSLVLDKLFEVLEGAQDAAVCAGSASTLTGPEPATVTVSILEVYAGEEVRDVLSSAPPQGQKAPKLTIVQGDSGLMEVKDASGGGLKSEAVCNTEDAL